MAMTREEAQTALRKVREKYPQYGELGDNELSQRLAAKYPQYQPIAEAVTQPRYAVPDYMARVLEEGGVKDRDRERLLNTGITPGTAAEWASAHIAMNKARGQGVSPREQEAIFDLYKQQSGRTDVSGRDFYAEQRGFERAQRRETLGGRLIDAGAAYNRNLAETGLSILGTVAPETANRLGENVEDVYGVDPDSRAGSVGGFVAEVPKLYASAATGPAGMASIYGAQGFGGTRREVADLRAQGQDISPAEEFGAAGAVGGTEAISGYVGGRIFQSMGAALQAMSPAVRSALAGGETGAVRSLVRQSLRMSGGALAEGSEEALTQIVSNKIRQGYNPKAALMDGVQEAFAAGMLLSPIGAAGVTRTGTGTEAGDTSQRQPLPESTPQAVSPRGELEQRLIGQEGTMPAQTPAEQQITGQQATDPTPQERERFFGTGTSEPTLQEEAQFFRRDEARPEADLPERSTVARRQAPTSPPQNVREAQWTGQQFTGPQATPPRRRRRSQSYPEGFDEGKFFDQDEISRLKQELAAERRAARTDKLTGLGNKREYDETLESFKQRSHDTGRPFSVIMFDAANLKAANDVLGHEGADRLLQDLGVTLRTASKRRAGDEIVTRQGGDEFAVILPDTDKAGAKKVLNKIEKAVGRKQIIPGLSMFLAGDVATYTGKGDFDAALREADAGVEAKKRLTKQRFGEVTERSEAEQAVADYKAQQVEPPAAEAEQPAAETAVAEPPTPRLRGGRVAATKATPIEGTSHKRRVPRSVESWLTPISSRIQDISTRVFDRLMRMEFNTDVARERLKKELNDPAKNLRTALSNADQETEFKYLVLNQRFDEARALISAADPKLEADFDQFVDTFRNLLDNQRDAGVTIGGVPNYWPRFIRDYRAFKEEFGDDTGRFEEAWDLARKVKGRALLTADEKAEIANSVIQGYGPRKPGSFGPPNARARSIEEVSREALKHYIDPFEAAFRYVDGATYAAERARFLGNNHTLENMDETIGKLVQDEVDAGRLNKDQQDELHDLLTTRFTADMLKPSKAVRNFKQMVYLTTLGQFRSTLTQLTDAAMTAAEHGLVATVKGTRAAVRLGPRDRRIVMEDIGVHDHGEEFKDIGRVARATDWTLRKTGFKAIDRVGKETRINAAWNAFKATAANPNSRKFRSMEMDYRPILGDEAFEQTMQDLREGKKTENVKYLLFLDITKVQPVTTSQMPEAYLSMPNGRILYALKTFTLTQLNHVRRDMIRKIATPGRRREGLSHLARYITLFTLMGMGVDLLKDLLYGREVHPDQIPDRAIDALLGTVGMNRYTVEQAWTRPSDAAINYIAPPMSWVDSSFQDLTSKQPGIRSIRNIPVIGELIYYWAPFGRGFQLKREEAKRDYRKRLRSLRSEAADALRSGDNEYARDLMAIYNERRKQGPGDGRKNPLTFSDLRRDINRGAQ